MIVFDGKKLKEQIFLKANFGEVSKKTVRRDLMKLLSVSKQMMSLYENGKCNVTYSNLFSMKRYFRLDSIEYFLKENENDESKKGVRE